MMETHAVQILQDIDHWANDQKVWQNPENDKIQDLDWTFGLYF